MKITLLILLTFISVYASSDETCYTVQLLSKSNTQEAKEEFQKHQFPQNCKVMNIGNSLTVRCGCYEQKPTALQHLLKLQPNYQKAMVLTTYKYRFDTNTTKQESMSEVEQQIMQPMREMKTESNISQNVIQNQKVQPVIEDEKPTCYTVQLISVSHNRDSLNSLSRMNYPKSCKLMEIGNSYTVRCGCYETKDETEKYYLKLKKIYQNAAMARTYKYRFQEQSDTNETVIPSTTNKIKVVTQDIQEQSKKMLSLSKEDEELRLILQVFLYKNDLKNAFKVAQLGYERAPNSYYWNQKMAVIAQWQGKTEISMLHLRKLYNLKYDASIEKELINYGIASYRYEDIEDLVVNKAKTDPTEKNIDLMIYVYKQVGEPEKVVKVLEDEYKRRKKNIYLTKALALSLEIGDLKNSKKLVNIIESKKPYTQRDAALISNYYYVEHDVEKSYKSLTYVDKLNITDKDDYVKYFELKSDLGWYLQDNANAALASQELMRLNRARLVDYERVSYVYKDTDPKLAGKAAKEAYLKYKLSYLFYSYANNAINRGKYNELRDIMKTIESHHYALENEALYWVMKSKVYDHYNKKKLSEQALLKALSINNNYEFRLILLMHYISTNENNKLKSALIEMESENVSSSYYFPFASAYYHLKNIDRASFYTQKLIQMNDPVTDLIEFRFMQAYIYQLQNNKEAFYTAMKSIVHDYDNKAEDNPALKKDEKFLSNYLRAAIYVLNVDSFKHKLHKAKRYLTKKHYKEIAYSFALLHKEDEKSKKIYDSMKEKDTWLRFSNALLFQRHSEIEDLLERKLDSLSRGDASQAAYKDGQKSLAQSIAFDILLKNNKNQNAYIQHMDLSKERTDLLDTQMIYNNRDPLVQKNLKVKNSLYISNGYSVDMSVDYAKNTTLDRAVLPTVPNSSLFTSIGMKKLFNRTTVSGSILYSNVMRSNYGFMFEVNRRLSTDIYAGIKVEKNMQAPESILLLLGGKKDVISANMLWKILNTVSMELELKENYYSSQDNVDIGESTYYKVALYRQLHSGYPDIRLGMFVDGTNTDENSGDKGVIRELQSDAYDVLEKSYYNIGLHVAYGMANSTIYTRVWRPYIEFSPTYNSLTEDLNYGVNLGIGGKIWHQDHLALGFRYDVSKDGVAGDSYQFYLNYQFLYAHPKILRGF